MFPKKSPAKKPIKLNSNSKKMNDMNAFIDNELKIMQSLNRRQHPTSLINPININNSMAESQNNLKNVMNKTSFGTQNKTAVEDPMRTSQSKFEGFSNVTKFTDNPSSTGIFDQKESRRTRRPPSTSSNKSEPFVIKFPAEQNKNNNKEILKHLNKDKEIPMNFKSNITGLKPENKINEEKKKKKPYIESYNKIEDKAKNLFGDEEIEEDYGDFENVDENKNENENKNDWEDMFGENANFNDIDEERQLKPMKINKNKSKRDQIIERMNDIKNIILLSEEYIEIASMEKIDENDNKMNLGNNLNNIGNGKQEKGINTDIINYKDKGTATEENFDLNLMNDDNDEELKEKEKEKDKEKEAHLDINAITETSKEKKSKIMVASYQPMSYDAYNVFVKIAPSRETML